MSKITLEDFLLTHSKIDKLFIYDFFMIQKIGKNSVHKPFIMDLDLVAKWLDTKKEDIKDTLIKSYIKDIDYMIIRPNRYFKVDIFLTFVHFFNFSIRYYKSICDIVLRQRR